MSRWKSRSNLVDPASCYRTKLKGRSGTCVSTYYTCTHGYGSLSSFMEAEGECCGCTYHVLSPAPICPYLHRAQMYIYSVAPEGDQSSSITTIVHGDLKLENVLIFPRDADAALGFKYQAKLCDFGF